MQNLFDVQKLEHSLAEGSQHVDGYLQSGSASIIWSIFDIQDELEIAGNLAEIGVYHGKLFILLCHCLRKGERAFAVDPFDTQPEIQGIKTKKDRQNLVPTISNPTSLATELVPIWSNSLSPIVRH
jgi:hypothetical protein